MVDAFKSIYYSKLRYLSLVLAIAFKLVPEEPFRFVYSKLHNCTEISKKYSYFIFNTCFKCFWFQLMLIFGML
jgi:hypothetical protein